MVGVNPFTPFLIIPFEVLRLLDAALVSFTPLSMCMVSFTPLWMAEGDLRHFLVGRIPTYALALLHPLLRPLVGGGRSVLRPQAPGDLLYVLMKSFTPLEE